jgi:hypothetical protein
MTRSSFTKGLEVYYRGMFGKIDFISEHYVTVCIRTFEERVRDVCLIVYPQDYCDITLVKESTK